jgi:hypothetical protein
VPDSTDRRWDDDERGSGIADASQFADDASELVAAMRRPRWIAEEPELHLLPHLERACEVLPFHIVDARSTPDGAFEVELAWTGEEAGVGVIRAAMFALLGSIAESSSYIRQRRSDAHDERLQFDVVTGMVDEGPFQPHGHTLRFRVVATAPTPLP